jgi:hypothetical protein
MSQETSLARDLLVRAGHTAYQAAAATFGVLWAQSDLHVSDLAHGAGWARLYSSVIVGVLAAVVSALKTAGVGYFASRRAKLIREAETAFEARSPKLTADLATGDMSAVIKDIKDTAAAVEGSAVETLQPTIVDGGHPAAADPDNKA